MVLMVAANIPFFVVGMVYGFISIVIMALWVGLTWKWNDHPYFLMLKIWFMGGFVIAIVDILRFYPMAEQEGVIAYFSKLQWSIGLSLIPLLIAGPFTALLHWLLHVQLRIIQAVERWIQKEKEKYERTWVHRKIVKARKQVRGLVWRVRNFINSFKNKDK